LFKINLVQTPSHKNIDKKYTSAISQVVDWGLSMHRSFNCQMHSVYVRGSVVQDFRTIHSDIDMVVLLKEASLTTVIQFEHTIDALLALYLYPFVVDVKVYAVDDKGCAEPATEATGIIHKEIKKHINFDLFANGHCVWGQKVPDHSTIFKSPLAFIENNIAIMGSSILQFRDLMINDPGFINYYPLIKKSIKLSAITHFKEEIGYLSTIKACFDYAVCHAYQIKDELTLLFNCLEKDIIKFSFEERDSLKKAILKVTNSILPSDT